MTSAGSSIFERLGDSGSPDGSSAKPSTTATAVRDFDGQLGNSQNGRANLMVDDDFDEDAYTEEEEDVEDEVEDSRRATQIEEELEESLKATQVREKQ